MTTQRKMNIQLLAAFILCIAGITLLIMGFWVPPVGEIHSSVLVAYGEVSTFAGGLFGVDYNYRYKRLRDFNNNQNQNKVNNE